MVKLMLISLIVMLAAIFALYFAPFGVAPLIAASLYAGLWAYERRLGVASPITRVMTVFLLLFAVVVHRGDDPSWMAWISPVVYWTLAALILALLAVGAAVHRHVHGRRRFPAAAPCPVVDVGSIAFPRGPRGTDPEPESGLCLRADEPDGAGVLATVC